MKKSTYSGVATFLCLCVLSLVITPVITSAQCVVSIPPCPGKKPGTPCACHEGGGVQSGTCQGGMCVGQSFSGGGQAGGAVDQGLKMITDMVGKVMEKLMSGQSSGGGGGTQTASTAADCSSKETTDWKLGKCQNTGVAGDLLNTVSNTGSNTSANNSVTTSLLESFADSAKDPLPITNVTPVQPQNQNPQSAITSVAQNGFVSAPNPGTPSTQSQNTAQDGTSISSPVNQGTSNVQETDDGVSVTSSGVDAQTNTGISSFFGLFRPQNTNAGNTTMLGRLCSSKPWESSLITRIFTARFFDSLCAQRMQGAQSNVATGGADTSTQSSIILRCPSVVQPGGEATIEWSCGANIRSSGIGFNTNGASSGKVSGRPTTTKQYTLQCAQGGSRSCVIEVANPRVDLVAYPERVQLGARAKLYWVSEGVEDCLVTGPGLNEQGPKGAAVTGAILDTTTFTAECLGANGATTTDTVIIDVGA